MEKYDSEVLISVIVVSYNSEETIIETLNSIKEAQGEMSVDSPHAT